uniref:DMT family transporter n=1 Tax=Caldisericum exile TaxID=693075 RepID=A0A7C4XTY4_9BACT
MDFKRITTAIFLGVFAMFCWGFADFFAAKIARTIGSLKALFWSHLVSTLTLFVIYPLIKKEPTAPLKNVIIIVLASFLYIISYMLFYRGLEIGKVSVVSPIFSSGSLVTVILSTILLGEYLNQKEILSISLIISGTVLTSFRWSDIKRLNFRDFLNGTKYALPAMLFLGVSFVFVDLLITKYGWFLPIFVLKSFSIVYLLLYAFLSKDSLSISKRSLPELLVIGLLESAAFLSFGLGVSLSKISIIYPISSAFPAITIFLARIFYKERLERKQTIGVLFIIAGLVLLNL